MRKLLPLLLLLVATVSFSIERQPNADYRARREALAQKAGPNGMFMVFAGMESEGPNAIYGFHQDENYYYLTGLTDPGGVVLIVPAVAAKDDKPARPYTEVLFLPANNRTEEKWTGPKLGPDSPNLKEATGFDRVVALDHMRDVLMEVSPLPFAQIFTNKSDETDHAIEWLRRANSFPGFVRVEDGSKQIAELRSIKDAGEIALIRKAVDASVAAHFDAMHAMRPGLSEHQVAALMEYEYSRRGCERPAYASIVGSGFNSTVLHYSAGPKIIKDGDIVVLDVAGEYSGYASDITRTLPANGHFTARQREIYDIVLGAQQAAMDAFKSGESILTGDGPNSLYKVAKDYMNAHGKDLHGDPLGQYFIHGLGTSSRPQCARSRSAMRRRSAPARSSPSNRASTFRKKTWACVLKTIFWVDPSGKLVKLSAALPSTADAVEKTMKK